MTEEDEILICPDCVKDKRYKLLIEQNNTNGKCTCCGKQNSVIDVDSNDFIQMTKALIRYHYSEWDYNEHFGGDNFGTLFYDNNNIFLNKENFKEADVYDELINRIECIKVYEDYDKGVSIFAGYYDGQQNPLLYSIKKDLDFSILEVEKKLKEENYFNFEEEITKILKSYFDICSKFIKKGKLFIEPVLASKTKKEAYLVALRVK